MAALAIEPEARLVRVGMTAAATAGEVNPHRAAVIVAAQAGGPGKEGRAAIIGKSAGQRRGSIAPAAGGFDHEHVARAHFRLVGALKLQDFSVGTLDAMKLFEGGPTLKSSAQSIRDNASWRKRFLAPLGIPSTASGRPPP